MIFCIKRVFQWIGTTIFLILFCNTAHSFDRCESLISKYNDTNSRFAQIFNSNLRNNKLCSKEFFDADRQMIVLTRQKRSIRAQLNNCPNISGGNSVEQLVSHEEKMHELMEKIKKGCAELAQMQQKPKQAEIGCVLIGPPVPTNCIDESSGKNCSCLNIENKCTYAITVKYTRVTSKGSDQGAMEIAGGKVNAKEACSTRRNHGVSYVSHHRRRGG